MAIAVIGIGLAAAAVGARAQGEAAAGGAPSSSVPLIFSATMGGQASYRQRLNLDPQSGSGESIRLGGALNWQLRNARTDFYSSLTPYYEWFSGDDGDFTTYGASAGLGMNRQSSLRRSWGLQATLEATPDQDTPPPQTSDQSADPSVRLLVPRNGYLSVNLGGSSQHKLGERLSLGLGATGAARQYNVYDVDSAGMSEPRLVDQNRLGGSASLSWKISEISSWSGSLTASRNYLSGIDDTTTGEAGDDTRDQVQLAVSWSTQLGPRSSLRAGSGYSALGTGGGAGDSTPTLDVAWSLSGERMQAGLSLRRDQGIFPGTSISASGNAVAGSLNYRTGERSNLFFSAGYAISADAGNDRDRTRTRNLAAGWTSRAGRLVWNVSLGYGLQSADGGPGQDVETARVAAGLGWSLTGAQGPL